MPERFEIRSSWEGAPLPPDEHVTLALARERDALRIEVWAPYHGDPAPPGPPGPTEALWEHEVVELFVLGDGPPGEPPRYTEVELGPHGHHLVLQLVGVRRPVRARLPLSYQASVEGDRWHGLAVLEAGLLPPPPHRINAFAIHGVGARRRYAALFPVPGPGPDFHRLEHFRSWEPP